MAQSEQTFRGRSVTWWIAVIVILVVAFLFRDYLPSLDQSSEKSDSPSASAKASPGPSEGEQDRHTQRDTASAKDLPGNLQIVGKDVFESPAGLRYGPGSREGHRLKHVLLHAKDQPDRPGSHGVFIGGENEALSVIDQAYRIAQQRGPPTRVKLEGNRTIFTVDMGRKVGFVGGQSGKRSGNPACTHVRLVLEDDRLITAYPLKP